MDLVLQAQIGSCPAAPGADLNLAISLLEMSVVGIPLLLALFQFINDHEYEEPKDRLGLQSVIYGVAMGLSALVLLGLYLVASCVIIAELGMNVLTILLFVFWWVLIIIIDRILSLQLKQMLPKELQYSLVGYLMALGLFVGAAADVFPVNGLVRWGAVIVAIIVGGRAAVMHHHMRSVPDEQNSPRMKRMMWRQPRSSPQLYLLAPRQGAAGRRTRRDLGRGQEPVVRRRLVHRIAPVSSRNLTIVSVLETAPCRSHFPLE